MRKIYIVSVKRDTFYDLSEVIPDMMKAENMTENECIDYFMKGLEGSRYMTFPKHTPIEEIVKWITYDMDVEFYSNTRLSGSN